MPPPQPLFVEEAAQGLRGRCTSSPDPCSSLFLDLPTYNPLRSGLFFLLSSKKLMYQLAKVQRRPLRSFTILGVGNGEEMIGGLL